MARAIVVSKAFVDNDPQYASIRDSCKKHKKTCRERKDIQTMHAKALCEAAGVDHTQVCGIEEAEKFQAFLTEYQLCIISREHNETMIFKGPEDRDKFIYIHLDGNHYNAITKITGYLGKSYFCHRCKKGRSNKEHSYCEAFCKYCQGNKCKNHPVVEPHIVCNDCKCYFKNEACFDTHKKHMANSEQSRCQVFYRCLECSRIKDSRKFPKNKHICGQYKCNICREVVVNPHLCHMQPVEDKNKSKKTKSNTPDFRYLFFDFESMTVDTEFVDAYGKTFEYKKAHQINFCVAQKSCSLCREKNMSETCEFCKEKEVVFMGKDVQEQFCRWLFSGINEHYTCFAHNFRSYDGYFILDYGEKQSFKMESTKNGGKIMELRFPNHKLKFLDSLNFIPMPLKKFPKSFGVKELKKGYFPHLFNTIGNQDYVGQMPDKNYFDPDSMPASERADFLKWYEENKHVQNYNLQAEMKAYCRSDVDILHKCVLVFRDLFVESTGIDPFESNVTIASACNHVFRANFLKPEAIGIIPNGGYRYNQVQSVEAQKWMKYLEITRGVTIKRSSFGGEERIGNYKIDGTYTDENGEKVLLEYAGCFWHGHSKCFDHDVENPQLHENMGALSDQFQQKIETLRSKGYKVEVIWGCEFRELQKRDDYLENQSAINKSVVAPLVARDALFGGRTNACKLFAKVENPGDQILYYDVCSLYPWVMKYCAYPIGHPEVILSDFKDVNEYFGLIKCKVLPPRQLYHPVLPVSVDKKLMFPLCYTCAAKRMVECIHSENERSFVGTWVTEEVKKAVEKGYKILEIYEVWHYEEKAQYDPQTQEGGLFSEYISTFQGFKQEASGWPEWVVDEKTKDEYIQTYKEREGVILKKEKIQYNAGKRAIEKLKLNNLWGKLAQRSNFPKVKRVSDPSEFFALIMSPALNVTDVDVVNDNMMKVQYKFEEEFVTTSPITNVAVAAFTTTHARLKLYSYLEKLQEQVLYFDTDSVIFKFSPGLYCPPIGDYLGDLTSELGKDEYITTFCSTGPKSYAFTTNKGNKVCKVKGITLNFRNSLIINEETMYKIVHNHITEVKAMYPHMIKKVKKHAMIHNVKQEKTFRKVYEKRYILPNFDTLPWGY